MRELNQWSKGLTEWDREREADQFITVIHDKQKEIDMFFTLLHIHNTCFT